MKLVIEINVNLTSIKLKKINAQGPTIQIKQSVDKFTNNSLFQIKTNNKITFL